MLDVTESKRSIKAKKMKSNKSTSLYISKILISIIIVLSVLITTNYSKSLHSLMKDKVINSNFRFNLINKKITKYFGKIIPQSINKDLEVFEEKNTYEEVKTVGDKSKIIYNEQTPIKALQSGIVVFAGEKDDLGYTIIVQGIDETDIWYSNIINPNIKLYDYIEKGTIIGEVSDYLVVDIIKDKNHLKYENYIKQD